MVGLNLRVKNQVCKNRPGFISLIERKCLAAYCTQLNSMDVFLLIEEVTQDEFRNKFGIKADPLINIIGIYSEKEKAEKEKEQFTIAAQKEAKQKGEEPNIYYLEERPVL